MTILYAPTNMGWLIARMRFNGTDEDTKAVWDIQTKMTITTLSGYQMGIFAYSVPIDPTTGSLDKGFVLRPPQIVDDMDIVTFFRYFSDLSCKNPPPMERDQKVLDRFKSVLGLEPCKFFVAKPGLKPKLEASRNAAKAKVKADMKYEIIVSDGWEWVSKNIGTYGDDFVARAYCAMGVLGANL